MREIAKKISLWNRTRKYKYFEKKIGFTSKSTLLDVGFCNHERNYSATNYIEKHYPYPQNITALGIEGKEEFCRNYPLVRVVLYDGKKFPFKDKSFDIGWSNAVIEHVIGGGYSAVVFFERTTSDMQGGLLHYPQQILPDRVTYPVSFLALAAEKNV